MPNTNADILGVFTDTLYVNNLTEIPSPITGNFNSKIALYVDAASNTEPNINLLNNMLKACKLGLDDCYLYVINNTNTESITILKEIKPKILISFGLPVSNEMMNLFVRKNDIVEFNNMQILMTDTLQKLQNSPTEKNALWQALQSLFKLV